MMSDNFPQGSVTKLLSGVTDDMATVQPLVSRSVATMNAIKSHILRNNLSPGDPLPTEAAFEAELGVSRSSVREALRKLEALDIVTVRQGSGSFVGDMSLSPLVEILAMRASLSAEGNKTFLREVAEARRAIDYGIAEEIVAAYKGQDGTELHAIVDRMIQVAEKDGVFMDEDVAFHNTLLSKVDNKLIAQTYSSFWLVHTSIVPNLDTFIAGSSVRTALAHRDMLEAALAGDLAAYMRAVEAHYEPLLEILSLELN